jgi:hypothetical protein
MRKILLAVVVPLLFAACGGQKEDDDVGQIQVALASTGSSGTVYRLRNAIFTVSSTMPRFMTTINSEAFSPDATSISTSLAAATYSVTLGTGWFLEKQVSPGTFQAVTATLSSPATVSATVKLSQVTPVTYAFVSNGDPITMVPGQLEIVTTVTDPIQLLESVPTATTTFTTRGPGTACGTQLTVGSASVAITNIAVLNDLDSDGNIKFLIFNHTAGDTLEFHGVPKAFVDDGKSWKKSNAFTFTLQANTAYCIVGLPDVGSQIFFDTTSESTGGLTTNVTNPNVSNFDTPSVFLHASADCGVRLFGF